MSRIFASLGRLVVILAGYGVASFAASAFLTMVFIASAGFGLQEAPDMAMGSFLFAIPLVSLFVGYFAFVPTMPAILLAEILGKRDWLFYALAGGVVGAAVFGYFWREMSGPEILVEGSGAAPDYTYTAATSPGIAMTMIAAGMFGGIAYWLVAGRNAGSWRRSGGNPTSPAP